MRYYLTVLTIVLKLAICNCENFVPDYKLALKYSVLFFEAQKSGKLPSNNRIPWRGDSGLNDSGDNGEDLSGGYYDGPDFVKFSFPLAYSITVLSWGVILYPDVYKSIGEYESVLDIIKHGTDYFMKCHVSPNELYGQVGDFKTDHKYWGRPEEMNISRPAYKINETNPGTDLAAEVSAALSSASIVFENINKTYTEELLNHSINMYNFAKDYRGLSKDAVPGAKQFYYEIYFYGDNLIWSALWLYRATNNTQYIRDAELWYYDYGLQNLTSHYFYFNDHTLGIRLLLREITNDESYLKAVTDFCDYSIDIGLRTPKGLIFKKKYGVLPLAATTSLICLEASKYENGSFKKYMEFAKSQVDYMLGSTGRSYVVGYGENYPKKPYHVASSCPELPAPCGWEQYYSIDSNPQTVYGALVSGPNITDDYFDLREDSYFEYNVVSLDANAGFQTVLAALIHLEEQYQRIEEETLQVQPLNITHLT
ncbi:uncharacterized protein LOC115876022 [Sitophilus oryzae]|uniref:cellulase n=1 Tax=Sitophilus oryzae TaxID=7048 RepID=A0A6J2X8N4_SITOR|nr:uncharacterized protein LOC115876022 [Sitophilus oryzae]XP_030747551.1 uncharacterized protein LOC115876022 [Sitophilus oryzae]